MYKVSTQNLFEYREKDTAALIEELAMGIAHDVRNPLAAAKGVLGLIELQHRDDAKLLEQTHQISTQIEYASRTLSSFYNMFNPALPQLEALRADFLADETANIFQGLAFLNGIMLKREYDYKGMIEVNRQGFSQILINFIKNAVDAAEEGALVTIGIAEEGQAVRIFVRDNGCGMSEDAMHNVFDAYFSTKPRGTGLGLNISMHIARYFGWQIEAESEQGKGACFSLLVPKALHKA